MDGKFYSAAWMGSERAALGEEGSSAAQQVRNSTPSPQRQVQLKRWLHPSPAQHPRSHVDPHAHYDRGATVDKITAPEVPAARTRNSVAGLLFGYCVLCKGVDSEFEYACNRHLKAFQCGRMLEEPQ